VSFANRENNIHIEYIIRMREMTPWESV